MCQLIHHRPLKLLKPRAVSDPSTIEEHDLIRIPFRHWGTKDNNPTQGEESRPHAIH